MPRLPALPELGPLARSTWHRRMVNEHGSAPVFEALAPQLAAAGADRAIVAECARFADEERMHGVLCGAVVEALGGEARALVEIPEPMPAHHDAAPLEAALRNVLSVCCMSETVAVALIGAERLEMPDGDLRDLLTRIYADEVGHARLGWRWLGEVAGELSAPMRVRLGEYLALAFAHLERHELANLDGDAAPPPRAAELGVCDAREARALFYATIGSVVVPRLEAHGLAASLAWRRRADVARADHGGATAA